MIQPTVFGQVDNSYTLVYEIGEVSYKVGDNGSTELGALALYQKGDNVVITANNGSDLISTLNVHFSGSPDILNWINNITDNSILIKLADDIEFNSNLVDFLKNNPSKKAAWELIHKSAYSSDLNVLNYVDELKNMATLGNAINNSYAQTFFNAFPNQSLQGNGFVIHHAIEKAVLKPTNRFYGIFTEAEIHSIQNLRGISPEINSTLHLSQIRLEWNKFYNQFPLGGVLPTQQQFLDKATEIDNMFGGLFSPPIRPL